MGRIGSAVPCDTNTRGRPTGDGTTRKPGENASTAENTSPLDSPTDSAYDAPSDTPPIARRSVSTSRSRSSTTASSTASRKATSGPKRPSASRSQVDGWRESGATTTTPWRSTAARTARRWARPLPVAPWRKTSSGAPGPAVAGTSTSPSRPSAPRPSGSSRSTPARAPEGDAGRRRKRRRASSRSPAMGPHDATRAAGWARRPATLPSAPGEDRLLVTGDALGRALDRHPPELQEHRPGRRVDEVAADRHLDHRAVGLRDPDEPGRVRPAQLAEAHAVHRGDLVGLGRHRRVGPAPQHDG